MKKTIFALLLVLSISATSYAGDIPTPPGKEEPPCTENCTQSVPAEGEADESSALWAELLTILGSVLPRF